jgi:hypothetical protein
MAAEESVGFPLFAIEQSPAPRARSFLNATRTRFNEEKEKPVVITDEVWLAARLPDAWR